MAFKEKTSRFGIPYFNQLCESDRSQALVMLRNAFERSGGTWPGCARTLGVSLRGLHFVLERYDMRAEADVIRHRMKTRFRLPPLRAASQQGKDL